MAPRWGRWIWFLAACIITAGLLIYLARTTTWDDWLRMFRGLKPGYFAAYLGLFLSTIVLRAWRYRILLRASAPAQAPGLGDLIALTLVSNLFVDLLPARSGSLAYVVFLNRKLKVNLATSFSSFAFAFVFDLVGMLPLFFLAVISYRPQDLRLWALWAVLALASLAVLFFLDRILIRLAPWGERLAGGGQGLVARALRRVALEVARVGRDMSLVRQRGVFGRVLLISILIRLGKYLGLYLLVVGLAGQWGPQALGALNFAVVLVALILSEAVASTPLSGIAGFGAYELLMMKTLTLAGLTQTQATLLPVALHLITQSVDYSLGSLALFVLSLRRRSQQNAA